MNYVINRNNPQGTKKSSGTASLSPKVYAPGAPVKPVYDEELLQKFIRGEIIFGSILMAIGGFVLRYIESASFIIAGLLFVGMGIFRLTQTKFSGENKKKSAYPEDRLLFRLKTQLNPDWFVALNYELPDDGKIATFVAGPGGLFVIDKVDLSGEINVTDKKSSWKHTAPDGEVNKIPNPLELNRKKIDQLQKRFSRQGLQIDIPPENCVVLMKHNLSGSATELEQVFRLGEITDYIVEQNPQVNFTWEKVDKIEQAMTESMHRIY